MKMLKKRTSSWSWTFTDRRKKSATIIIHLSWDRGARTFTAGVTKRFSKFEKWPALRTATPEELAIAKAQLTEAEVAGCVAAALRFKGHVHINTSMGQGSELVSHVADAAAYAAGAFGAHTIRNYPKGRNPWP